MSDQNRGLAIVSTGMGTAVVMWTVGYLSHIPSAALPGGVVLPLLLLCLFAGGLTITRHRAPSGWASGAAVGVVAATVNLLVLGSLLGGQGDSVVSAREVVPSALVWVPGSFLVSAIVAAAGAIVGRRWRGPQFGRDAWRSGLALVALLAAVLVVIAGGLVTSLEAGLAVPDWPNSFGTNMFLYPLARMTGGIYYEHAHRLYGSLVGLTTVVLAIVIFVTDRRRWMWAFAVGLVVAVIVQGVLGGQRVNQQMIGLAIVHGVLGQLFLAALGVAWAVLSPLWRAGNTVASESARADRWLTLALAVAVVVQLVFGAMYRHLSTLETPLPWPGHVHLMLAAFVAVLAIVAGLRVWARYAEVPLLRSGGALLMILVGLQLLLGIAALVAVFARRDPVPPAAEVILTTTHQVNGALILVVATQLVVWVRRSAIPVASAQEADRADRPAVDPRSSLA